MVTKYIIRDRVTLKRIILIFSLRIFLVGNYYNLCFADSILYRYALNIIQVYTQIIKYDTDNVFVIDKMRKCDNIYNLYQINTEKQYYTIYIILYSIKIIYQVTILIFRKTESRYIPINFHFQDFSYNSCIYTSITSITFDFCKLPSASGYNIAFLVNL